LLADEPALPVDRPVGHSYADKDLLGVGVADRIQSGP
jgi:hypothetical protein